MRVLREHVSRRGRDGSGCPTQGFAGGRKVSRCGAQPVFGEPALTLRCRELVGEIDVVPLKVSNPGEQIRGSTASSPAPTRRPRAC